MLSKLALARLASAEAPSIVWELRDDSGLIMAGSCQQLMRDTVLLESCSSSIEVNKPSVN